ncbi:MAG TPA: FAD-binding oxidoreductase [Streptosporangiaceae bacterium]|jgi:glycine/D-amino acid oxidase-like deaminating enzyme|nr:FAD-binding oxidoreductase [Streptosporangiaceae bacterium]
MSAGRSYDVVVVGAGIVGSACAYFLARAGLTVAVVERGTVASGTTSAGEGNLLVSDKEPGPEMDLALLSNGLWRELGEELGPAAELEPKGGLVVAAGPRQREQLDAFAATQAAAGVQTRPVAPADLRELEPHLAPGLAGGVFYPQDMQVQPMMAAALLLRLARGMGADVHLRTEVTGVQTAAGRVTGVRTSRGVLAAGQVVNAAGPWAGELAALAGLKLPVLPRRGFIVVTEPLPVLIRHKVYTADYVANVASGSAGLETSTVIEGTAGGTILIGASRERVGFDRDSSLRVVGMLAGQAMRLFPVLAEARAIRFYRGFRPYCPDHLPVIGADDRLPGLLHACGHEGAGVGLAPVTGQLIAQVAAGQAPSLPLAPLRPTRFEELASA